MNPSNLDELRTNAYNAGNSAAGMTADAPGLLQSLRQNLVGIFSKDNPLIQERNNALADYLSENSATRASLLPSAAGDVPGIAGRPLTYSPTQQDAITTARSSAALAPLAGYNEILKGMYGSIGDLVKNAGDLYTGRITAAQQNASNLLDLYKSAISQYSAEKSGSSGGGIDLSSILALIQAMNGNGNQPSTSIDDIFALPTKPLTTAEQIARIHLDPNAVKQVAGLTSPTNSPSASFAPPKASKPAATTPAIKIQPGTKSGLKYNLPLSF